MPSAFNVQPGVINLIDEDGDVHAIRASDDTDVERGLAFDDAITALQGGNFTQMIFGPGVYDIGSDQVPRINGVGIEGFGQFESEIKSSLATEPVLLIGDQCRYSKFRVNATNASNSKAIGASDLFGGIGLDPIANTRLDRISAFGRNDAIFMAAGGDPAPLMEIETWNCHWSFRFDGIASIHNCHVRSTGDTFIGENMVSSIGAMYVDTDGKITCRGARISLDGTGITNAHGVQTPTNSTANAFIDLHGPTSISVTGASGNNRDITQSGSGVINVYPGVMFDPAKTAGTINFPAPVGVRSIGADPTSSATFGRVGEIVYSTSTNNYYGKHTTSASDTNWRAL